MPATTNIVRPIRDKHIADLFIGQMKQVCIESTQILGPIKGVLMSIRHGDDDFEIPMATLDQLDLVVAVPEEKHVDNWEIQAKVEIKLSNLELVSNVGNLVKLTSVFEDNSDEISPFIKLEDKWYKQIEMRIGVKEGGLNIQALKTENKS